ncbi:O-acetyltransferase OatA [compost metagenome]
MWLGWRTGLNLLTLILGLAVSSALLNLWMVGVNETTTFYLPFTRMWEMLAGTLLAWASLNAPDKLRLTLSRIMLADGDRGSYTTAATTVSLIGLVMIVMPFWVMSKETIFPGWAAMIPVAGTILVIAAGNDSFINRKILGSRIAVAFGLISFPLYLWHWPLLSFARIMEEGNASREIRIAAVLLSIILAYLTYRLIESSIRFRKGRAVVPTLLMLAAVCFAAGLFTYKTGGFPARTAEFENRLGQFTKEDPLFEMDKACLKAHPLSNYCMESKNNKPDVMIISDSHGRRLFPGLEKVYAEQSRGLMMLGGSGCPPLIGIESGQRSMVPRCAPLMNYAYAMATKPEFKTVIISGRGPLYIEGSGIGNTPDADWKVRMESSIDKAITAPSQVYAKGLEATFDLLKTHNKEVIFFLDNPELGFKPVACFDTTRPVRLTKAKAINPCGVSLSSFLERNRIYRDTVKQVASRYPNVKVFDSASALCTDSFCSAKQGENSLYVDGDHLSVLGSMIVAEKFKEFIE